MINMCTQDILYNIHGQVLQYHYQTESMQQFFHELQWRTELFAVYFKQFFPLFIQFLKEMNMKHVRCLYFNTVT